MIGAQVGYPDLAGFGRRFLDMAPTDLTAAVLYQIGALDGLARAAGSRVRYVKPHGALYNAAVDHDGQATAVVDAVIGYDASLPILGLAGSALLRIADERGLRAVTEILRRPRLHGRRPADRPARTGRTDRRPGGGCRACSPRRRDCVAESFCTHGDSPNAVAIARAVRGALETAGMAIAPFVDMP